MIALILTLLAQCPPGVDVRACAAADICVERLYAPREPADGVTASEASLVARLEVERSCSLAGWSLAITSSAALRAVRPPPICPACPISVAPECDSSLMTTLVGVGSCALCGSVAGVAARAVP